MSAQHVLVVEDSPVYRRLLVRMLAQWGYIVSEAENGIAALQILESQPVSMVISDWEMPEMDGLTLCREIRSRQFGHYTYLILLTARENSGDLTLGFDAGADDFLSKPVEQAELRARLHAGARILMLEATLAAHNTRLSEALRQIELDLEAAARIQHSVLPSHQLRYRDFFSDWLFLPSAWVSGDIFNVFPLDNHLGFYCVDVSGHGVGAAMMSLAVARQFLHGRAVERFLFTDNGEVASPADVVQILNSRFCSEEAEIMSYFTMIYGVIDLDSGEGRLCQAGHPTPFIVNREGALREVGLGGPPVGLFSDISWEDTAFELHQGELLFLYSDGISECESASGEMFGAERLKQYMAAQTGQALPTLFAAFAQRLEAWQASEEMDRVVADDISLLVIQRVRDNEDNDETDDFDGITVVTPLARRLDASVALAFKNEVLAIIQRGDPRLVLDFSKVDFIDSSCLGALISLLKATSGKGELVLSDLNGNIRTMFTLTRMDRVFTLFPARQDAIASLRAKG